MKQSDILRLKVQSQYFKQPSFARSLLASDSAKKNVDLKRYQYISSGTGEIIKHDYQKRAVASATKSTSGVWSGELWTGAGKSYVAAWTALAFMKNGKAIFICPNRTGMGSGTADVDEEDYHGIDGNDRRKRGGIIFKFAEIFNPRDTNGRLLHNKEWDLGALNEASQLKDVYFFTPHGFVTLKKDSPKLFRAIVDKVHTLIIDEAHHFPAVSDKEIYGKISPIAQEFFVEKKKKVVALTATFGRSDGEPLIGELLTGKVEPDFKMTVQEAVNIGRCPVIHGLPVPLSTKAPNARAVGDFIDLKLRGKKLGKYLQEVAGRMLDIQHRNKNAKICAFVRTVREARFLANIWNAEAKTKGYLPLAVLVGKSKEKDRQATKRGIMNGKLQGFVTCNVGTESLDIPSLEIVHLIRRTKSINLLVQSIGRALRMHEGKRRTLICDYHVLEGRVIRACKGLADYAVFAGRKAGKKTGVFETDVSVIERETESGGSLIFPEGDLRARFSGPSLAQEKEWIIKNLNYADSDEMRFQALEDFAKKKMRPILKHGNKTVVHMFNGRPYTEADFARALAYVREKTQNG
jgi:superfamily II DNA or RNA helicase